MRARSGWLLLVVALLGAHAGMARAQTVSPSMIPAEPWAEPLIPTETPVTSSAPVMDVASAEAQAHEGMVEAPSLISQSGVRCTLARAAIVGQGVVPVNGKPARFEGVEVACREGVGFMFARVETGEVKTYGCAELEGLRRLNGKGLLCRFTENRDGAAQLRRMIEADQGACDVHDWRYLGFSKSQNKDVFEVACAAGGGYVLSLNRNAPPQAYSCLQVVASFDCKLTPAAERMKPLAAWAKKAEPACVLATGRFAGRWLKTGDDYFEVACASGHGFYVIARGATYRGSADCVTAASEGLSCALSNYDVDAGARLKGYGAVFAKNKIACMPTTFHLYGREHGTNREVVEVACPQQPTGVLALMPVSGSSGALVAYDCFAAAERKVTCTLTTKAMLLAQLGRWLAKAGHACSPVDFRVVGPDTTDGDLVEVACGPGLGGYVLDLAADRSRLLRVSACADVAASQDKCVLAGNVG